MLRTTTAGTEPRAHEIRPGHVQGFLHWRRTHQPDGSTCEALSARTLAKDRAVLHAVCAFGEELEVVQGNPVRVVAVPKGDAREPIILTDEQYEALLDACEDDILRTYVLVLGEAGLRCESEALWLRWQDVDLERRFLTVESVRKGRRTKSGKSRKVPLTHRLREALRDHAARYRMQTYDGKRSEWVFHHPVSRRTAKAGKRIRSLRAAFDGAAERAEGVPADLHQHDLRHRRATTWLADGQSPVLVQNALGHADIQTTMRYTHLVDRDLLALVAEPEPAHAATG